MWYDKGDESDSIVPQGSNKIKQECAHPSWSSATSDNAQRESQIWANTYMFGKNKYFKLKSL